MRQNLTDLQRVSEEGENGMIVGTRESALAMAQTVEFKDLLKKMYPDIPCEIQGITSFGDVDLKTHLKDMGGSGVFVRELDEALLSGKVDVTVNSLKDIPVVTDPRITVAAVLPRADTRDACIPMAFEDLVCGTILGTSSVRREWMVKTSRANIRLKPLRGNMNTRLSKLEAGEYSAIIIAKAGLDRLGISENVHPISKEKFIPAAGQGAIAIECRSDDKITLDLLRTLDDPRTRAEVETERAILRYMDAGCSSPIGVNAEINGDTMRILAVSFINSPPVRIDITFPTEERMEKAKEIANRLVGTKR